MPWYRLYSDKWIEQGGIRYTTATVETVKFNRKFEKACVQISGSAVSNTTTHASPDATVSFYDITLTNFKKNYVRSISTGWSWYAVGS